MNFTAFYGNNYYYSYYYYGNMVRVICAVKNA